MDNNEEVKIEKPETLEQPEVVEEPKKKKPKKKRKIWAMILNFIGFCLLIFVAFETIIAFLNFNLIQNKEEPKYFVTKSTDTKGEYNYTIYDMGLYRIVRKENKERYEIKLLPFFLEP